MHFFLNGINNQGDADARNTEYCGETCKFYFAKHRLCYSLHPEPFILHLSKDKLWFACFLIKHLWNNQFGKLNADCDSNTASVEGKRLIDNNSRPLENGITFVVL